MQKAQQQNEFKTEIIKQYIARSLAYYTLKSTPRRH